MAGLQRSAVSFRRQGSSGLIWNDNFFSGELQHRNPPQLYNQTDQLQTNEIDQSKPTIGSINTIRRNRSGNGGASPAIEPPSPRVPVCGLCSGFSKPNKNCKRRFA